MAGESREGLRGSEPLTIGELARRTGLSVSAIRFYETKGLVASIRSAGGQRRFRSHDPGEPANVYFEVRP